MWDAPCPVFLSADVANGGVCERQHWADTFVGRKGRRARVCVAGAVVVSAFVMDVRAPGSIKVFLIGKP
jgi:hypothetical protein